MPVSAGGSWLSNSLSAAFDASTELWVENPESPPAAMAPGAAPAAPAPKLPEAAEPHALARLHAVLVRNGQPAGAFDSLPLPQVYPALAELGDRQLGVDYTAIPERVLRARAKAAGKSVHSEWTSFAELLPVDLPPALQSQLDLQNIARTLDEIEDVQAQQRRLAHWLTGDLSDLSAFERHVRVSYLLANRYIGADRNARWVPRIQATMVRTNTAFVCVGVLHLLGPDSIQANLTRTGVPVRRV